MSLSIPMVAILGYGWIDKLIPKGKPPFIGIGLYICHFWSKSLSMLLGFLHLLEPVFITTGLGLITVLLIWGFKGTALPSAKWSLLILALIPLFLLALPPPWMRDSMTYHLALPKIFGINGGFVDTDRIIFQHFPLGWQSILSLLFCFGEKGQPFLIQGWSMFGYPVSVSWWPQGLVSNSVPPKGPLSLQDYYCSLCPH